MKTVESRLHILWMAVLLLIGMVVVSFGGGVYLASSISVDPQVSMVIAISWVIPTLILSLIGVLKIDKHMSRFSNTEQFVK